MVKVLCTGAHCCCPALCCGSRWQQRTGARRRAASLELDGKPSLSFQKARFHFIPTLLLVRRPRKAFCFIRQIAAFFDLHRMKPFPFQPRSSSERAMPDMPPGSPWLMAPKQPCLIPEDVKMGHYGWSTDLSRGLLQAEIIEKNYSSIKTIFLLKKKKKSEVYFSSLEERTHC